MSKLSKYFSWAEAVSSKRADELGIVNLPKVDCTKNIIEAASRLDEVRELLNSPIIVSSWYRCEKLNAAVGGAKTSAHISGWAVDFTAKGISNYDVACMIRDSNINFDQLILEPSWVHISFDPKMRRDCLTLKKKGSPYLRGIIN